MALAALLAAVPLLALATLKARESRRVKAGHRSARAAQGRRGARAAASTSRFFRRERTAVRLGLGRTVTLRHRPPTLHQTHEANRCRDP